MIADYKTASPEETAVEAATATTAAASTIEIKDDSTMQKEKPIEKLEVLEPKKNKNIKVIGKNENNIVKKGLLLLENEIKELLLLLSNKEISTKYQSTTKKVIKAYIENKYYSEEYLERNMNYDENNIDNITIKNISKDSYNFKEIIKNLKIVNNIIDNKEINIELSDLTKDTINRIKDKYSKIFTDYNNKIKDDNFEYCENILNDKIISTYINCSATFNKIYSDYAVEKSLKKVVIREGIDEIKLRMLSMKIFNNMLNKNNYQYKYILYLNSSLYKKEKKLNSFLKLMDDPYSQSKMLLAIDYETLLKKKEKILKYRQMGYRFVVEMKDQDFNNIDTEGLLYCEYIFVNTNNDNINEYYNSIPFNMINKLYLTKQTILFEEMK